MDLTSVGSAFRKMARRAPLSFGEGLGGEVRTAQSPNEKATPKDGFSMCVQRIILLRPQRLELLRLEPRLPELLLPELLLQELPKLLPERR